MLSGLLLVCSHASASIVLTLAALYNHAWSWIHNDREVIHIAMEVAVFL